MEPKRFRHFKGNEYTVLCEAHHSETNEDLIIYKKIDDNMVWARPKSMFFENVENNGKIVPRFAPIPPE
jgi:hypothetical protein